MKIYKKVFWKISNLVEMIIQKIVTDSKLNRGVLRHKKDNRDHMFKGLNDEMIKGEKELMGINVAENFSIAKYQYSQNPFNDCVFASGAKGCSDQDGINWSVRWVVKNARRLGYISGNGYSYTRSFLKVATKVGLLPYRIMPDETVGLSWNEFSKWTSEDQRLLKVAEKYKLKNYKGINNKDDLILAIKHGYAPISAGKWYSSMNVLKAPSFLMKYLGRFVGGHAYRYTGWSFFAKFFEVLNTFGEKYGDKGKGWLENPFNGYNQYGIYMLAKLPFEKRVEEFKIEYEGKMVRTKEDGACFLIDSGKKRHVPTMEIFWNIIKEIGDENFDNNVKQDVLDSITKGDDYLRHIK